MTPLTSAAMLQLVVLVEHFRVERPGAVAVAT